MSRTIVPVALAVWALTFGCAAAQDDAGTVALQWRATPGDPELVSLEVEKLYTSLSAAGFLTTEPYVDTTGQSVEEIVRAQNRFVGQDFPSGVDKVLCTVNPATCTLTAEGIGSWHNGVGDTLNLPQIRFVPIVELSSVKKAAGEDITDLLAAQKIDCIGSFGIDCMSAVAKLNSTNKAAFDISAATDVILPQQGWEAAMVLKLPQKQVVQASSADIVLPKAVLKGVIGGAMISAQSLSYSAEPDFHRQQELRVLIGFKLDKLDDVPESMREPVGIAVIDSWLDEKQCDLKNIVILHNIDPPERAADDVPPPPGGCGEKGHFAKPYDHGSHVAGIIGAALDGQGTAGLEPFAKLYYHGIDKARIGTDAGEAEFSDQLRDEFFNNDINVFNLSWDYTNVAPNDLIKRSIRTLASALFVVAAGNDGEAFAGNCDVRPACFTELPNVLTVVGLDRSPDRPKLWTAPDGKGSNSSPNFGIGAIAVDVLSSASDNRVADASGTSQAAPQVAAAAGYVLSAFRVFFGADEPPSPGRIKNRLIYTADLYKPLLASIFGGRLDIERAADVGEDRITIQRDGETKPSSFTGELLQLGNNLDDQYVACEDSATAGRVTKEALERMTYFEAARTYALFFRSRPDDPGAPLLRETNCSLSTVSHLVRFRTADGHEERFQISDIRDFTSSMHLH